MSLDKEVARLNEFVEDHYEISRERSLALTKLDEFKLWIREAKLKAEPSVRPEPTLLDKWMKGKAGDDPEMVNQANLSSTPSPFSTWEPGGLDK